MTRSEMIERAVSGLERSSGLRGVVNPNIQLDGKNFRVYLSGDEADEGIHGQKMGNVMVEYSARGTTDWYKVWDNLAKSWDDEQARYEEGSVERGDETVTITLRFSVYFQ